MAKAYNFTPKRRAALAKAQFKSAQARKGTGKKPAIPSRGVGITGLKNNTRPYVRANKLSTTVGVNSGTVIPGTRKRIAVGLYARVETIDRKNTRGDKAVRSAARVLAPTGTKRRSVVDKIKRNVKVSNPAIRVNAGGAQARLGTSRSAGPTVIIRKGQHKTPRAKSKAGIKKYDSSMSKLKGAKTSTARPQRRKSVQ